MYKGDLDHYTVEPVNTVTNGPNKFGRING